MKSHDNLSRSECSFTDTSISSITSDGVSSSPTKSLLIQQKSVIWKDIECPLCHESVEKISIRKHQENDCPERLEFCPQCYLQVPQSQLKKHGKICTAPPKINPRPKEKVAKTKALSFKGTVFDKHVKIAESFTNIARGHQDIKPPYEFVVKAERKVISQQTPSLDVLVNKFCPAIYLRSNECHKEVDKPQQNSTEKNQSQRNLLACREVHQVSANSSATNFERKTKIKVKNDFKPIQAPEKAIRLREVHRSLADLRREECSLRMFRKSWLEQWRRSKERKRERRILDEEQTEDRIIDEAIELEMNKDTVSLIPKEKWPNFVQDIKKRRSKWKDLGLNRVNNNNTHDSFISLSHASHGDTEEKEQIEDETVSEKNNNNKITEFYQSLENFFGQQQDNIPESSTDFQYFNQLYGKLSKQPTTVEISNGSGFYKPCESCYQLFHENHIAKHTVRKIGIFLVLCTPFFAVECKCKKERAIRTKQRIKETWKNPRKISSTGHSSKSDILRIATSPALSVPRPFGNFGNESSLASFIAPHSKNKRSGNYYAFMTKI